MFQSRTADAPTPLYACAGLQTFGRGKHKESFAAELGQALAKQNFGPGRLLWLLNNTLCERTYVARKLLNAQ